MSRAEVDTWRAKHDLDPVTDEKWRRSYANWKVKPERQPELPFEAIAKEG